jgi:hypothetical protein
MRSKLNSILTHPAAGLVTIVVVNAAMIAANVIALRALEKKEETPEA